MPYNIKDFWNKTQKLLKNSIMIPDYMPREKENSYFAYMGINELPSQLTKLLNAKYFIKIELNRTSFDWSDCAHEVAHVYVIAQLNYCYPWLIHKKRNPKNLIMIENIYDIAIHPVIDRILKERGLFSDQWYERKFNDVLSRLGNVTKENLEISSIIYIVDSKHRLPDEMFKEIIRQAESKNLHEMVTLAQSLPIYEFDFNDPSAFKSAIIGTFQRFKINYFNEGVRLYEKDLLPFI